MKRFMSHVRVTPGCWEWTGHIRKNGYGHFGLRPGNVMLAHRAAWLLQRGDPGRAWVLHSCDNPCCVRLEHLRLGDAKANVMDRIERGPAYRGAANVCAKLTTAQAERIRWMFFQKGYRQKSIAERFGVSQITVSRVVRGRTYKEERGPRCPYDLRSAIGSTKGKP